MSSIRRFLVTNRIRLGFIFLITLVLVAQPNRQSGLWGLPLLLVGATLRFWAAGHLVRDRRLATRGPYAYTRNPLYLGTAIEWLGLVVATNRPILLPVAVSCFAMLYVPTICEEEQSLSQTFGAEYAWYCANVPRLIPRRPRQRPPHRGFVWILVWANKEHLNLAGICLVYLAICTRLLLA
jgi:protein-S-isoprenylcysteine O-methyltransferase Ste14